MKIKRTLPNGSIAIECAFCSGTGTFPDFANMDEDSNETCDVCNGTGILLENIDRELLIDCARCSGEGKKYDGAYFLGNACEVCKGKGYVSLQESAHSPIWDLLHPKLARTSKTLFEDGNYTEAVFTATKSLNTELKDYCREKTGQELDGCPLAGRMLSIENPILSVADLKTETGRNLQKGLMQLVQGLFIGIRNPISHDQTIGMHYCIHIFFLISLIHYQLDYTEMRRK